MLRRALLLVGLVNIFFQTAWAGSMTERQATIRVTGALHLLSDGEPTYELRVTYRSEEPTLGDALLIYAEPSHILLLAHVNGADKLSQPVDLALARVAGGEKEFSHVLSLPYDPTTLGDRRIKVVMRSGGQDWPVADGMVNMSSFDFETTFSVVEEGGSMTFRGGTHCCSSKRCGKICDTCSGPFFTCDLINCTISCESL